MCHFFLSASNFFYFQDPLSNLPQNTVRRCLKSPCRNRSESLYQCRCLKYLCSNRSKSLRCFFKIYGCLPLFSGEGFSSPS
ncbi:hypothetical protein Hanom_Chr09g00840661 [Helianthus anomalus]